MSKHHTGATKMNLHSCTLTHTNRALHRTSSLVLGGFLPSALAVCAVGLRMGIQVVSRQLTHRLHGGGVWLVVRPHGSSPLYLHEGTM